MVNVAFGSYEDFKKFFYKAPSIVRKTILKAYPKYAAKITQEYRDVTSKVKKGAQEAINDVKQAAKSTTKTAGEAAKKVSKSGVWSKVKAGASKAGSITKGAGNIARTGAAGWVITDPRTTWNQKGLAAGMLVPNPIVKGASIAGLTATGVIPAVVNAFYNKKNEGLFDDGSPYGDYDGLANVDNMPSQLKPLTIEEQRKARAYNTEVMRDLRNQAQLGIAANQAEQNEWNRLSNNNYEQEYSQQYNSPPSSGLIYDNNSSVPTFPNIRGKSIQSVQNAQQRGLIPIQDNQIVNQNQPALTGNVMAPIPSSNLKNIPDYQTWNANVDMGINDLYNKVNEVNQPVQQGVQTVDNTAGSQALLQYLQMQQQNREQQQQQADDILKQYQEAVQADRKEGELNRFYNAIGGALGEPETKAPIYYIGANGEMRTINLQQPNKPTPLPTDVNTKSNEFINALKVKSALAPSSKGDRTADVLTAQAMGDMYGVNPLIFLNPDLAKEYLKNQGTIENTRVTGSERRKDIPLQASADIMQERTKAAGNMAIERAKFIYDMSIEHLRQSGMNERQAAQIASQQAQLEYNNTFRAYLQQMEDNAAYNRALLSSQTQKDVANIYRKSDSSKEMDPLDRMNKAARVQEVLSGFTNPQERQSAWDFIQSYAGGNQNANPAARYNPYGTTINEDAIIRRQRGR